MSNPLQIQIIDLPSEFYNLLTINTDFNLNASINSDIPLIYESQNINVVTVNQNGDVSIAGPGKTLIKIYNLGNQIWAPIEKFVLINVSKKQQKLLKISSIENKFIGENIFNISEHFISTSGLPIKFKSLNPEIAEITEDGTVKSNNVGTLYFEAFQEGNLEWEEVKIIDELGISLESYPFDLELTSKNTNTLIKFNLYKVDDNNLFSINNFGPEPFLSISGGLYFANTVYPLKQTLLLPTGEYIGILNYERIENETANLVKSFYGFSYDTYTGCESNGYISFELIRSGFINYGIDVIVQAVFNSSNGYKYASKLALESGIFWSGSFAPNEPNKIFTLPVFKNTKIDLDVEGQLGFIFVNRNNIPSNMIVIEKPRSTFKIVDTGICTNTINTKDLLPYFPKDLGQDFSEPIKQASLSSSFPQINQI
jgi:hypothetical protein